MSWVVLQVSEAEKLDRLHVGRLIQLVADTGWLPQPLALTTEIVELIDGAGHCRLTSARVALHASCHGIWFQNLGWSF